MATILLLPVFVVGGISATLLSTELWRERRKHLLRRWPAIFVLAAVAGCVATVLASQVREPRWTPTLVAHGGMRALLAQPIARHYALVVALTGCTFGAVFTFEPAQGAETWTRTFDAAALFMPITTESGRSRKSFLP